MNRAGSLLVLSMTLIGAACSSSGGDDSTEVGKAGSGNASSGAGAAGTSLGGAATSVAGAATGGAVASGGAAIGAAGAPESSAGASGSPSGTGGAAGINSLGGAGNSAGGASGSAAGGSTAGASAGGSSGHGGSAGTAGTSSGSAGSAGTAAGGAPTCGNTISTATRPQLTGTQAANDTVLKYLAQSDNWNPTAGLGSASAFTANYTVAADGSGTHKTVQAAINAATGTARRYILVKPGTYREIISYKGTTPLTIYGTGSDAKSVVIVDNQSAASAGGTPYSATFTSTSPGLQLVNLTVSNDFATPATGDNIQAVALYVTGDKTVLQNVRLHGFQDTFYADTASDTKASRIYVQNSFIEGDTDFIFGGATLVIDSSTLNYLSSRKGTGSGVHLAPSTRVANNFGFLVIASTFTSDGSAPANKISLGRSWDQGGVTPTPNGQAVIRESVLGAHIRKVDPWAAAASSGRAFSATGNRLFEYCNSGTGAGG